MYNIGEYIVYKRDVCHVEEIIKDYYKGNDYYHLIPMSQETLKLMVPVNAPDDTLRPLKSKEDVLDLIGRIKDIPVIPSVPRNMENEYKQCMSSGNLDDLVKIIKTTYSRNKQRTDNNKKVTASDDFYFHQAETYLYNELSIVLDMSVEDAKEFVNSSVEESKTRV